MQKESSKVPDALTDEELDRLLRHCPDPTYTIAALAADTEMRRSEIGRLCWGDIDFGVAIITVRKTKNGRFRVIPMTLRVMELLGHSSYQMVLRYAKARPLGCPIGLEY